VILDTKEIVRGLDPVDWLQIKLIADLPPERKIIPAMRAQEFAMATFRCALEKRYPNLTRAEINMKVLEHFTSVRIPKA